MPEFGEKYEKILDGVIEGVYKLAETFAEEQVHAFAEWLADAGWINIPNTLAEKYIREMRG